MLDEKFLERLKAEVTLDRVVGQYTPVRPSKEWRSALCLNHADKNPSLKWKEGDTNAFCHACQWTPDIFTVIQKAEGCEFSEAVKIAKSMRAQETSWDDGKEIVERAFKEPLKSKDRSFPLSSWGPMCAAFMASKVATAYVLSRGISRETAAKFKLGFRPNGKGITATDDPHFGCPWIGIPYIEGDKVVNVKWRDVNHKEYRAQSGMTKRLFNDSEAIDEFGDLFLTAGEFDCMVLEQAGFRCVSMSSDSKPPTMKEREPLVRAGRLVLAGDADLSGQRAMNKLGVELKCGAILKWPDKCKDANEFYLKNPRTFADSVRTLLDVALVEPMPPGFISLTDAIDGLTAAPPALDPDRFRWPWDDVDEMCIMLPGHVITVSSTFTGTGKSTFVYNGMLFNATRDFHKGVRLNQKVPGYYAAEQSPDELARMGVAYLSLDGTTRDKNSLIAEDIEDAKQKLSGARFYIGYDPTRTRAKEVVDLCEAAAGHLGLTDLVIDNMGFIGRNEKGSLWDAQADCMQRLKNLAKSTHIRVWVVCAARKSQGGFGGGIDDGNDIHGTQAFEADADHVLTLHRPIIKNAPAGAKDFMSRETFITRKKSRHPGTGPARTALWMVGERATFVLPDPNRGEL